jgi:DNA-binding transcriptional regulator YiaG
MPPTAVRKIRYLMPSKRQEEQEGSIAPSDLVSRRERLGLSQSKLAEELGVTPSAVSMWEAGKRTTPGWLPRLLGFIEAAYDVERRRKPRL